MAEEDLAVEAFRKELDRFKWERQVLVLNKRVVNLMTAHMTASRW